MQKHFIDANTLLLDSYTLAKNIYTQGLRPDFIVGVWRGGTPVAIAVHEFLDVLGITSDHIAIRSQSYSSINQREKCVQVSGLEYLANNIQLGQTVLLIDDVFDTGLSLQAVIKSLRSLCQVNFDIKIACPWYKPSKNQTQITPDYYLYETDNWLVFPHELEGLNHNELRLGKGEAIANIIEQALSHTFTDP